MSKVLPEFVERMQYKLDKNKDKDCPVMNPDGKSRGWVGCKPEWLLERIREEANELEKALNNGSAEEIKNECADIGNFAMMIFDVIE